MTSRAIEDEQIRVGHGTVELAVSRWGDEGPAMVLLHPGVGDRRIWRWCAPAWAESGFRVVAHDRRGFGDTVYDPSVHDDVDDRAAVMDAASATPAIVVGNSRGGELAVEFARRHPERVAALVLIAPFLHGYDLASWEACDAEEALDDRIAAASETGDLDEVNRLELHYWLDGVEQPEGRVQGEARTLMADMNGRALRAPSPGDTPDRPDLWAGAAELDHPTLVVVGDLDLPGLRRLARELATSMRHARFAEIAGAAHCPSLDQPDALTALVASFARDVGLAG